MVVPDEDPKQTGKNVIKPQTVAKTAGKFDVDSIPIATLSLHSNGLQNGGPLDHHWPPVETPKEPKKECSGPSLGEGRANLSAVAAQPGPGGGGGAAGVAGAAGVGAAEARPGKRPPTSMANGQRMPGGAAKRTSCGCLVLVLCAVVSLKMAAMHASDRTARCPCSRQGQCLEPCPSTRGRARALQCLGHRFRSITPPPRFPLAYKMNINFLSAQTDQTSTLCLFRNSYCFPKPVPQHT